MSNLYILRTQHWSESRAIRDMRRRRNLQRSTVLVALGLLLMMAMVWRLFNA